MLKANFAESAPVEKLCEAKVFSSKTLPECHSENVFCDSMDGLLVAKVPVLIAEPRIQIDIESEIKLDEPALEIKRIKKNVYLTQCKLLNVDECKKGKLFLSGFVRKNIEYSTVSGMCGSNYSLYGDIRHTTVKIPFECVTMVEFICPPEIHASGFIEQVEMYSKDFDGHTTCEDKIIGNDPCEQEFKNYEYFSERVFCELVEAKVIEEDIRKNPAILFNQMPSEQLFDCMIEKMVIILRLKLLQKQQIKVSAISSCCNKNEFCYFPRRLSRVRRFGF